MPILIFKSLCYWGFGLNKMRKNCGFNSHLELTQLKLIFEPMLIFGKESKLILDPYISI